MAKDAEKDNEIRENREGGESSAQGERADATDSAGEVARRIGKLTDRILDQADALQSQIAGSEIRHALAELENTTTMFRSIVDSADSRRVSAVNAVGPRPDGGSSCCDECGPKCCIELFISRIDVMEGQGEGGLELIVAVKANGTWGMAPGLSSHLTIPVSTEGVAVNEPITRLCVPRDGCLNVPIHGEALEVPSGGWGSATTEGALEMGSARTTMTLNCECDTAPIRMAIGLTKKDKRVNGVVQVEVAARRLPGGCC